MAWQLVHPNRVDKHSLRGSLTFSNTVEFTVFGDDTQLYTHEDGAQIPEGVKYVWRGGCVNTTEDPAIKNLWLANGYQVDSTGPFPGSNVYPSDDLFPSIG